MIWDLHILLGCHCTSGQQETTAVMGTGMFTGMRLGSETLFRQGHLYLKGSLPRLINIPSNNRLFSSVSIIHSILSVSLSLHVCPDVWKMKPQWQEKWIHWRFPHNKHTLALKLGDKATKYVTEQKAHTNYRYTRQTDQIKFPFVVYWPLQINKVFQKNEWKLQTESLISDVFLRKYSE